MRERPTLGDVTAGVSNAFVYVSQGVGNAIIAGVHPCRFDSHRPHCRRHGRRPARIPLAGGGVHIEASFPWPALTDFHAIPELILPAIALTVGGGASPTWSRRFSSAHPPTAWP